MDRFVLTDAQWAKMEPHCLGKVSDPGRTGGDNRLFLEAVLWICHRRLASGIRCSSAMPVGCKLMFSNGFSTPFRMSRTWNLLWLMRRLSRSIATDRAQKGDPKSGHRAFKGRNDHQNPRADRRAGQSCALRPAARPPLRYSRRRATH
jgi:hypothetical protein